MLKRFWTSIRLFFVLKFTKKKEEEVVVESYLNDEKVLDNLTKAKVHIAEAIKGNTMFLSPSDIFKRQMMFATERELVDVLNLLCLKEMALNKVVGDKVLYSIVASKEERIKALYGVLSELDVERAKVTALIQKIQKGTAAK